jgi:hypothetical protein
MAGICTTYGRKGNARWVLVGNLKDRYRLEDLGVDKKVIKRILQK